MNDVFETQNKRCGTFSVIVSKYTCRSWEKDMKQFEERLASDTNQWKGKATTVHALRVPGGWGSQISWQSAHEGGKVVSPSQRPPLPPLLLEAESMKFPMTPSGIEPATIRLVAQCLNQPRHRVSPEILPTGEYSSLLEICAASTDYRRFEGTRFLQIAGKYLPAYTALHVRRLESSAAMPPRESHTEHIYRQSDRQTELITYEMTDRSQLQQKTWQIPSSSCGISSV